MGLTHRPQSLFLDGFHHPVTDELGENLLLDPGAELFLQKRLRHFPLAESGYFDIPRQGFVIGCDLLLIVLVRDIKFNFLVTGIYVFNLDIHLLGPNL